MKTWIGFAGSLAFFGCVEELDPASIVKTTRVLAIVAEPPVAPPGEDVRLSALLVNPDDRSLRITWSACSGFGLEPIRSQNNLQYGQEPPSEGCVEGAEGTISIESHGDVAILPGALTRLAYDDLEALAESYGDQLPPEVLRFIVETSGLPITIGVTVRSGNEELVRSFKRVLLYTGEPRGTNPPAPRFAIDEAWVSGRDVGEPWTCLPESGETPVVTASSRVVLTPDPDDASWQESYRVIDATGTVVDRQEGSYYAWFSTAGDFESEGTQAPLRDDTWKAPRTAGPYPIWVVVRDGHGGTSACRTDIEVR